MPEVTANCYETISKVLFINKQDKLNRPNYFDRQASSSTGTGSRSTSPNKKRSFVEETQPDQDRLNDFISKNGLKLYKTSASSGLGIHEGFMHIAKEEALNFDESDEEER